MAVRLRRRGRGVSALFDAILFFIIILAASGALFYWANATTAGTTADLATRDLGRYAADVLSAALSCTVGPVNYSVDGETRPFSGTVHDCLLLALSCTAGAAWDNAGLVEAGRGVFALLVEKPYHFGLNASLRAPVPHLWIPETACGPSEPGAVRWTCSVPLIGDGIEGELRLFIWR